MRIAAIMLALAWSLLAAPVALAQSTAKAIAQSNILRETSRLAERGDAGAQYRLGFMYAKGRMVTQDFEVAAKWLHKAAEQGHAEARFYLGWLYYEGKGVLQDYTFAHMWYNIAGRLKNNARHARDIVAKKMTRAQIADAQRRAREWLAKHEKRK